MAAVTIQGVFPMYVGLILRKGEVLALTWSIITHAIDLLALKTQNSVKQ